MSGERYTYHYDDRRNFEQHAITATAVGWRVVSVQDAPNGSVDAWYERSSPVVPLQHLPTVQPAPRADIAPYPLPRAMPPVQAVAYQPPTQMQPYRAPAPPQQFQPPQSNYYVQQAAPPVQTIILIGQKSPNLFLRLVYFVCIGWWVSFIWSLIAWIFIDLIITMPLGLIMVNNLPFVATLKRQSSQFKVSVDGSVTTIQVTQKQQVPVIIRILFFLIIGWWFSGLWMLIAWLVGVTLIGIPLAFWMYNRVPAVTTLRQY